MNARNRRRKAQRLSYAAGTPPGTLHVRPEAAKPVIRIMAYGPEEFTEKKLQGVAAIKDYVDRWPVIWVNVDGLGDAETIRQLGDLFNLHRLALEDVLNTHQRPKVEEYGNHLFVVVRMLEAGLPVSTEQVSVFFDTRFVLTLQEHVGDCFDPVRKRIRETLGRIRNMGADYLAYSLMDSVVDAYFPFLDEMSDRVEALETEVLEKPNPETVAGIHEFKRDLLSVRRVLSATRETVNALLRENDRVISDTTRMYLRDCYDNTVQLLDMVETYREVVSGLLEVYLSSVNNRMNEVMKVLTMIATVFIPLSFLASLYGMNFDFEASPFNMPELHWYWGYPMFLLLLTTIVVFELVFFWRRGWLGRKRRIGGKHHSRKRATDSQHGEGQ